MSEQASPVSKAHSRSFGLSEFKSRIWFYELAEDQKYEHTLDPTFWVHIADGVMGHGGDKGRGDDIVCWKPDTAHKFRLTIVEIGKGFIKVVPWSEQAKVADVSVADDCPFKTRWNVGKRCHDVLRSADNAVMAQGFQSKATAVAWINDHLQKVAA
jgi:hypothetical protein